MPVISVGGMRFQTSWKREDPVKSESVDKLETIVARAMELGMNHFETAYGYGTSEVEFGSVLSGYDRDSYLLQTKGGPKDTVDDFLAAFDESLKGLQADRLDLFAIHGINNDEILQQVTRKGGVLDALLKLKSEGVIGAIGFSTHGPVDSIIRAIQTDAFDYVNLWHSYIYPFNLAAISEAAAHDMGVFIISPNDKGGMLYDPPQKLVRLTEPLSPMAFNDLFILSHPNVHTISCGASKPSDFDVHVDAVEKMDELADVVNGIARRLDAEMDTVISPDWAKNYLQGLPACPETPGYLNVPVVLWLWNLLKAFDLEKYAKMRFNLMGNAEHWFPGCKSEVFATIDRQALRRSLDASPYADQIMDVLDEAHKLLTTEEVKRLSEDD